MLTGHDKPLKAVQVKREMVKLDLIEIFKDPDILQYHLDIKVIGNNGVEEEGKGSGVVREVLSLFWNQCYTSLMVGASEKVPNVRHDFQKCQWEAVGRILVYGYVEVNFFPISISRAFMATLLFGEESMSSAFLLDSFKLYISLEEKIVVEKALTNFDADDEDLLDFLSSFKCFSKSTAEKINAIILELAHQEIVQKPRYISDCMTPVINPLRLYTPFQTLEELTKIYDDRKPSCKKIIKLLAAQPQNDAERGSFDHFKRYIKNLQGKDLEIFLQFLTGSTTITCTSINVNFTQLEGVQRRPIIHTCGPSIDLPSTYQSFSELSEEFSTLISDKKAWFFNVA